MISPFIQNLGQAKGFNQDEQLVLQVTLGSLLGNNAGPNARNASNQSRSGSNSLGNKIASNPWMAMITTLASLLVTHQALQKMGIAQSLSNPNGLNQVNNQTLGIATNMSTLNPFSNQNQATNPKPPIAIAPMYPLKALSGAHNSIQAPSLNTLSASMATFDKLVTVPSHQKAGPKPLAQLSPTM